jgi:hypothetical protein
MSGRCRLWPADREASRRIGTAVAVLLGLCAAPALAQMTGEDQKAIAAYPLSMEKVDKALKASAALHRLLGTDPGLAHEIDASAREASLDQQIRTFESKAKVGELVRSFNITVRDFCLTIKAVAMAQEASRMPPKLPHPAASPEHIQFYRDHQEEIDALEDDVRASYRQRMTIPQ